LEVHEQRQREARLVRENASLKTLVAQRHEGLLQRIRELKAEPPRWGYRRIWAHLHGVERRSTRCACGVGGEHTASCCPPSCASQPRGALQYSHRQPQISSQRLEPLLPPSELSI
jgi:hypothetical protein